MFFDLFEPELAKISKSVQRSSNNVRDSLLENIIKMQKNYTQTGNTN